MELFSIVCTTCKSRLRVRDPAAVGQILACPRCGGMVMVKPPPDWSGETVRSDLSTATGLVSAPPAPDQTVSSSAFDAIEELLAEAPPRHASSAAPAAPSGASAAGQSPSPSQLPVDPVARGEATAVVGTGDGASAESPAARTAASDASSTPPARPRFVGGPARSPADRGKKAPPGTSAQAATASPPSALTSPGASQPAGQGAVGSTADAQGKVAASASASNLPPPPPQEAAATVAAAPSVVARPLLPTTPRFWLALGGSVAAGIVLAVVAVAGAIHFFYGSPGVAVSKNIPSGRAAGHQATSPARPLADRPPQPTSAASTPSPGATPAEAEQEKAHGGHASQAASAASPSDAPWPVVPPAAPSAAAAASSSSSSASSSVADQPASRPADAAAGLAPAPLVPRPQEGGIEALARFDRFLAGDEAASASPGPPAAGSASEASAATPAPTPLPEGAGQAAPRDGAEAATGARPAVPRPPPLTVDVPRRLADPLMRVETSGTPLVEFLQLFSDLSTIPITLQPDALPLVRLTPLSPVRVETGSTTVGDALVAALRPLGLEAVPIEDQLIVRVIEPAELRTIEYPTKDLADDEAGRIALAQLLQAVVEPASWGEEAGQGSITVPANKEVLSIRQRQAVHAALFIGCEKLRVARGKPPASTRYDAALFALDSRWQRAAEKLGQKVTANFRQSTRLVTILKRLGERTGTTILVDWHDLASLGWNPQAEASIVFDNQTLEEALDALLGPMELAWRVVDAQTLQVVSPQRLATQGELEVYPVGPLVSDDPQGHQLVARVQAALGEETFAEGLGMGVVRYDPLGRCLLAWLPQPKQRQLERQLQQWRAAQGPAPDRPVP